MATSGSGKSKAVAILPESEAEAPAGDEHAGVHTEPASPAEQEAWDRVVARGLALDEEQQAEQRGGQWAPSMAAATPALAHT